VDQAKTLVTKLLASLREMKGDFQISWIIVEKAIYKG
jgi:hypothetical protein